MTQLSPGYGREAAGIPPVFLQRGQQAVRFEQNFANRLLPRLRQGSRIGLSPSIVMMYC